MSKTNSIIRTMAAAAILPLLAHAGAALAGPAQPGNARWPHPFGDPDSGGEVRGHIHGKRAPSALATLADKGDVIVRGPGGGKLPVNPNIVRPTMLAGGGDGTIVHGPGGGKPPVRPSISSVAMLAGDGPPIIRGGGGAGGRPTRLQVSMDLAMVSNDGTTVSGPGGTGKPPIRPNIVGASMLAYDGPVIVRGPGGTKPPSNA